MNKKFLIKRCGAIVCDDNIKIACDYGNFNVFAYLFEECGCKVNAENVYSACGKWRS